MDIVYILGKGSRWHNNEIRFSLRSLEKYFNFGKVFIVGEMPEWMQGVTNIPCDDKFKNKLQNARAKYLTAANCSQISNNFILMNDDFFFLKEVKEIPYYSRGTSYGAIENHQTKGGYYYEALKRTKARIEGTGFTDEVMDFEIHAPIIFNKEKLKNVMAVIGDEHICLLRTCYGNLMGVEHKIVDDFKVAETKQFYKELRKGREFLSTTDSMVVSDEFRKWIWEKYPEPSKYEMDAGAGSTISPGQSLIAMRYYAKEAFAYGTKSYQPGDRIDNTTIKEVKLMKNLRAKWEYK